MAAVAGALNFMAAFGLMFYAKEWNLDIAAYLSSIFLLILVTAYTTYSFASLRRHGMPI